MKLATMSTNDRLAILATTYARDLSRTLDEMARHNEPELVALWEAADRLETDIIQTLDRKNEEEPS